MTASSAVLLCAARAALALVLFAVTGAAALAQPLPSWNEGPAKARTLAVVQAVTDKSSNDFAAYDRKSPVGRLDKGLDAATRTAGRRQHEERLEEDLSVRVAPSS